MHCGVDQALLYLGITHRDDFDVCHRRPCLARPWTGGKTMRKSASPRHDPKGLIVAVDPD